MVFTTICVNFCDQRAVIKFVLRAASTLENTDSEQRVLRKFLTWNLSFIER